MAETIDAMHSSEWVQKASYNISAGTLMNQTFVLDKYGIVWETIVDFTGSSVRSTYYYWYNGTRNFVISFARSLLTNSSDGTYLGPQDYLYGTIKIDISPDWKGGNRIWIGYSTRTQLPGVSMGGNMYVDVDS
ncbi:MAG: hypothetical protein ACXACU_06260 [Candidatus Hodarchaeales archaeon]